MKKTLLGLILLNSIFLVPIIYGESTNKVPVYNFPNNQQESIQSASSSPTYSTISGSNKVSTSGNGISYSDWMNNSIVSTTNHNSSTNAAITEDGNILLWGSNNYDQLATSSSSTPSSATPYLLKAPSGQTFTQVVTGPNNVAAITNQGDLYIWGSNTDGQLGVDPSTSSLEESAAPVQISVSGITQWDQVSLGQDYVLALGQTSTGTQELYTWGDNNDGQLGNGNSYLQGTSSQYNSTPTQIPLSDFGSDSNGTIKQIGTGSNTSYVLFNNGDLYSWGSDYNGQIGMGATESSNALGSGSTGLEIPYNTTNNEYYIVTTPTQITTSSASIPEFTSISVGPESVLAEDNSGNLWSWGDNTYGQLGNKNGYSGTGTSPNGSTYYNYEDIYVPTEVWESSQGTVASYSISQTDSILATSTGSLYYSGLNYSELSTNVSSSGAPKYPQKDTSPYLTEVNLSTLPSTSTDFTNVSAGVYGISALNTKNQLYMSGTNTANQFSPSGSSSEYYNLDLVLNDSYYSYFNSNPITNDLSESGGNLSDTVYINNYSPFNSTNIGTLALYDVSGSSNTLVSNSTTNLTSNTTYPIVYNGTTYSLNSGDQYESMLQLNWNSGSLFSNSSVPVFLYSSPITYSTSGTNSGGTTGGQTNNFVTPTVTNLNYSYENGNVTGTVNIPNDDWAYINSNVDVYLYDTTTKSKVTSSNEGNSSGTYSQTITNGTTSPTTNFTFNVPENGDSYEIQLSYMLSSGTTNTIVNSTTFTAIPSQPKTMPTITQTYDGNTNTVSGSITINDWTGITGNITAQLYDTTTSSVVTSSNEGNSSGTYGTTIDNGTTSAVSYTFNVPENGDSYEIMLIGQYGTNNSSSYTNGTTFVADTQMDNLTTPGVDISNPTYDNTNSTISGSVTIPNWSDITGNATISLYDTTTSSVVTSSNEGNSSGTYSQTITNGTTSAVSYTFNVPENGDSYDIQLSYKSSSSSKTINTYSTNTITSNTGFTTPVFTTPSYDGTTNTVSGSITISDWTGITGNPTISLYDTTTSSVVTSSNEGNSSGTYSQTITNGTTSAVSYTFNVPENGDSYDIQLSYTQNGNTSKDNSQPFVADAEMQNLTPAPPQIANPTYDNTNSTISGSVTIPNWSDITGNATISLYDTTTSSVVNSSNEGNSSGTYSQTITNGTTSAVSYTFNVPENGDSYEIQLSYTQNGTPTTSDSTNTITSNTGFTTPVFTTPSYDGNTNKVSGSITISDWTGINRNATISLYDTTTSSVVTSSNEGNSSGTYSQTIANGTTSAVSYTFNVPENGDSYEIQLSYIQNRKTVTENSQTFVADTEMQNLIPPTNGDLTPSISLTESYSETNSTVSGSVNINSWAGVENNTDIYVGLYDTTTGTWVGGTPNINSSTSNTMAFESSNSNNNDQNYGKYISYGTTSAISYTFNVPENGDNYIVSYYYINNSGTNQNGNNSQTVKNETPIQANNNITPSNNNTTNNNSNIIMYLIVGLVIGLIIIGAIIVFYIYKKKKSNQ